MKPYYITTAIAYTSRTPHIGNTYEAVLADSIARFKRQTGYDVFFQTGTDEHGQKIQQQAQASGVTPKELVDQIAGEVKQIWDMMNTSYDKFIRTTDGEHERAVQKIFRKLYDQGDIYKGTYEGLYCTPCESFFTESQLVEGKCPDCGREVEKTSEEAYFLRLSKYQDRLMKHIEENPEFIQPESRRNEMVNNFLKPGLQDLCVSRTSFSWGIPVDFDDKHVVYVWVDALSNYITGLGYDPDGEPGELFKKYWPADVHLIGKDILRFHTIYWPIMLMALGVELPKKVFGHPWLMTGMDKMSKSRGNVIYAKQLVRHFGVDAVRYYVLHEMPFAQDGTMTYSLLVNRINSDLANILGNLVNRTVAMVDKYFGGVVQAPSAPGEFDQELVDLALSTPKKVERKMDDLRVADAMDEIWTLLRRSNKYIDETTPWILAKDEAQRERLGTVLYNLLESIRFSAVLLKSFMPETAEKILRQINAKKEAWESLASFDGTLPGEPVGKAEVLFARIDEAVKLEEIEKEMEQEATGTESAEATEPEEEAAAVEPITIDDFFKVQMKIGEVLSCEPVKKSDKLLVSQIKVGKETCQIVSGIANWYKPEEMVGKKVVVVMNLKPVKLRGVLSEGMILAASDEEGNLNVLTVDGGIGNGADVG
ncbi:methionine--tRNA ligase [Anaerotalea alkaliphila]|uniref:Methionine--tRNA ligase n=1 Tax=Anaerotalea alkaliphila TaxID=2662126 RepID=A0A7X5HWF7_9FIRM|nr:methionine--tRNA ligase [Anaerotalea alkaliphila]NDL67721.1 methionine--tRNA ligase [Anaerotalea alkaliphila]